MATNQPVQESHCGAPKDCLSGVLVAIKETAPRKRLCLLSLRQNFYVARFYAILSVLFYCNFCMHPLADISFVMLTLSYLSDLLTIV